jgi:hypothetical protein
MLLPKHNSPTSIRYKMTHEEHMQKALAKLESSLKPNYATIAKKYKLD